MIERFTSDRDLQKRKEKRSKYGYRQHGHRLDKLSISHGIAQRQGLPDRRVQAPLEHRAQRRGLPLLPGLGRVESEPGAVGLLRVRGGLVAVAVAILLAVHVGLLVVNQLDALHQSAATQHELVLHARLGNGQLVARLLLVLQHEANR